MNIYDEHEVDGLTSERLVAGFFGQREAGDA